MKIKTGAILSDCRTYRYVLWRVWDESLPLCNFIMLNPSTADENEDDPTIRRVINYASDWGYGGVYVTNLFAFRVTDSKELKKLKEHTDLVGPNNDDVIMECAMGCDLVMCAWGNNGGLLDRSSDVVRLMKTFDLYCVRIAQTGEPMHPLYQKKELKPIMLKEGENKN